MIIQEKKIPYTLIAINICFVKRKKNLIYQKMKILL